MIWYAVCVCVCVCKVGDYVAYLALPSKRRRKGRGGKSVCVSSYFTLLYEVEEEVGVLATFAFPRFPSLC